MTSIIEGIRDLIISETTEEEKGLKEKKEEIIHLMLLGKKNEATEKIVKHIKTNEHIKTTRDDQKSEMWIYKEGIYIPEGKTYIQEYVRYFLEGKYTTYFCNQVISKIEADTYINQEEFFNKQNEYPEIIPVQNGLLNIREQTITNFTPMIPFFNKLTMNYNKNSSCPKIKMFLKEVLPPREDIYLTIQELFGYSLVKHYKYEKAFMFEGIGRNGKSKLLSIFEKLVGNKNTANVSLKEIEPEGNFSLAYLHNKLLNICGELSKEAISHSGNFKRITGGDTVNANRKFKNAIEFKNYAKIIFASNDLPFPKDLSDGFWLRWILIEFPYQFLPEKEMKLLNTDQLKNVKLQNPNIINDITNDDEMEGLLKWSLEGYQRLIKQKDFSYKDCMNDVKTRWLRKSNSVLAFIEDHIIEDYDSMISKQDFKRFYSSYCKNHGLRPLSDKVIKIALENNLGVTDSYFSKDYNDRIWVWNGIGFVKGVKDVKGFSTYRENLNFVYKGKYPSHPSHPSQLNNNLSTNEQKNTINLIINILKKQKETNIQLLEQNFKKSSFNINIDKIIDIGKNEGLWYEPRNGILKLL